MVSPTNYEKIESSRNDVPHKWKHRNQDLTVMVAKLSDREPKNWVVLVHRGDKKIHKTRKYVRKSKARKKAVRWMNQYPNP